MEFETSLSIFGSGKFYSAVIIISFQMQSFQIWRSKFAQPVVWIVVP